MPRIYILVLVAVVSVAPVRGEPPARYTIESKEVQKVVGVIAFEVYCKNLQATEWQAFAPVAPELPGQTAVKTTASPGGVAAKEKSPLARPLLIAKLPAKTADQKTTFPIQVTYQATLHARELKTLTADAKGGRATPLTAAETKAYLSDHGDIDYKADTFRKWLAEKQFIRDAKETDIDFARRVFLGIKNSFKYQYHFEMSRQASTVCQEGKSDCGGLSQLFVATMRANKVPARSRFGRWAKSAEPKDKLGAIQYFQWHVKAEFYADGVGWVPLDLSQAVEHDKEADSVKHFGVDAGDFITFHIDANYVVDVGAMGLKQFHSLQRPAWWVSGQGSTTPAKETESWLVKPGGQK